MMPQPTRLLTVKEFAARYDVDERTVRRWMRDGAVEVLRVAPRRGVRIIVDDELLFLTACATNQSTS